MRCEWKGQSWVEEEMQSRKSKCLLDDRQLSVGCVVYQCHQVMCAEVSRCYDDVNICLWTDGSRLSQTEAQTACQQRNNSFLVRASDTTVAAKLPQFRSDERTFNLLENRNIWIDVRATVGHGFHWIDGSALAGLYH